MPSLSHAQFNRAISPGPRLPWLSTWLLSEVWTHERYADLGPVQYLERGEREISEVEEVLAGAAQRTYDELLAEPLPSRDIHTFLDQSRPCAAVVFDGLSLREIPAIRSLAERSHFAIREIDLSLAAAPSETLDFIDQRLRIGKIAPSQLPSRRDLREKGIAACYYSHATQRQRLDEDALSLLLWSSFPDQTYSDSGARFAQHFEQINTLLESAWMNTVQQIPKGRTVLVTSDHGYVYFGAGLSFARSNSELRPLSAWLGGERFRTFGPGEDPPPAHPDLAVLSHRNVAMIRGRVQTHPQGPSANKLYKHGGLSLMEMLVPWVVLEPQP
jgi:hypothetical protein